MMGSRLRRAAGWLLVAQLACAWLPVAAAAPDWSALRGRLQALQVDPMTPAERQQRLDALQTTLPPDAPYEVQRELLLARIMTSDGEAALVQADALRQLAAAHGDTDTADWMAVRRIFDTHSDHNIQASLDELDTVRLRLGEDASLQLREAVESSYAFMYWDVGSFELALRHLLRSRELMEQFPHPTSDSLPMRGIQLARLYLDMDDPDGALQELAALREAHESGWSDTVQVAWTISQASALRLQGHLQESRAILETLLRGRLVLQGNDPMRVRVELMRTQLQAGDDAGALRTGRELEPMQAQAGSWFAATIDVLRGQAIARSGGVDAGLLLMQRGIDRFIEAAHVLALNDALARKVEVLRAAGRNSEAIQALEQRNELSMRMFRNSRALGLASLQVEQQLAERERRIVQLSGENQLQRQRLASRRLQNLALLGGLATLALVVALLVVLLRSSRRQRQALWQDGLTKAYTRPYLSHWLQHHPLRAGRQRWLLLLDLDFFKAINDTHGHACGDEVLRSTGARLRDALPEGSELFRWGGEEFLVIIDLAAGEGQGVAIAPHARNLLQAIAGESMRCAPLERPLPVSVSIGGAALQPGDEDLSQTLAWADAGLYLAKASGRGVGTVVGPADGEDVNAPRNLDALVARIDQGEAWLRRVVRDGR